MSDEERTSTPIQAATQFKELVASAAVLNAATDEFSRAIAPLDVALQHLNIGIECWVRLATFGEGDGDFKLHEVGYARINKQWGIALRIVTGHEAIPESESEDRWLFNDGPRFLRV